MADEFNTSFVDYTFVAFGGALGALFRFLLTTAFQNQKYFIFWGCPAFPISTLLVNILGSFLIGVFYFFFSQSALGNDSIRLFAVVGFLGSFTTFSTFSLETFMLLKQGSAFTAVFFASLSVLTCVLSTLLGFGITRILIAPSM